MQWLSVPRAFLLLIPLYMCIVARAQQDTTGSIYQGCNHTILEGQGIILSPNFPQAYNSNSLCQWRITVERDRTIMLSFRLFEIESSANCAFDSVTIYNGPSTSHPQIGRFCGAFRPSNVITTSNRMLMTLKTDESTQKTGFFAVFTSVAPLSASPNSCGGLITDDEGSFHSINFPKSNYPNSVTCVWHIRTAPDRNIALSFDKLTLETSNNCRYDSVTVFSGWSTTDDTEFLGRFCTGSDVPEELVSTGNEMFITFATDSSGNDVGFLATYMTRMSRRRAEIVTTTGKPVTTSSPGSTLCAETEIRTSATGVITSPGYKRTPGYVANLHCTWRIVTDPGTRVVLRFVNFQLEADSDCIFDYVSVFSGRSDVPGAEIGRFCGSMTSREVESPSNEMFILFVSDSAGNAAGFRATYTSEPLINQEADVIETTSEEATPMAETTTAATTTTTLPPATTTTMQPVTTTTVVPTEQLVSGCSCDPSLHLHDKVCSSSYVAIVKVVSVQPLPSGAVRARVSLLKMLKQNDPTVSMRRRAKFWLDVNCPSCFLRMAKRAKYIVTGAELTQHGGQLTSTDHIGKFSKKVQRAAKKAIRRCRRARVPRTRKRRNHKAKPKRRARGNLHEN